MEDLYTIACVLTNMLHTHFSNLCLPGYSSQLLEHARFSLLHKLSISFLQYLNNFPYKKFVIFSVKFYNNKKTIKAVLLFDHIICIYKF